MQALTDIEHANIARLNASGVDFALMEFTETGLRKSILDAHSALRELLASKHVHDYSSQGRGVVARVKIDAVLMRAGFPPISSVASLVRPESGGGDPRIWFSGLREVAKPWDKAAVYVDEGRVILVDLSDGEIEVPETGEAGKIDVGRLRMSKLAQLWNRATGGSGVASTPVDEPDNWPVAKRAAGLDEALEWFDRAVRGQSVPRFLFLVGGPGAGKSHAALQAVAGLDRIDNQNERLAQRTYKYACGDRELVLINDATITSDDYVTSALAQEIAAAELSGALLLACVNRGVLVEELSGRDFGVMGDIGSKLIQWIDIPESEVRVGRDDESEFEADIVTGYSSAYLRTSTIWRGDEIKAEVAVVFVDACSLLERSPVVESSLSHEPTFELKPSDYRVAKYLDRPSIANDETAAGELFARVIDSYADVASPDDSSSADPFAANLASLSSQAIRSSLLTVLRGSEIIGGRCLSFRELWGAIARSIVGDAPNQMTPKAFRGFLAENQPTAMDPVERWGQFRKLAAYRFSQALFGVGDDDPRALADPFADPLTRLTWRTDPVRDAMPGLLDLDESGSGWATPVVEAFAGPVSSESPLDTLLGLISTGDEFGSAVSPFDRLLDEAFVAAAMATKSDADRAMMFGWYGRYLTRLYAASNGIPAFRWEVSQWLLARNMTPQLPTQLKANLSTLLRPERHVGGQHSSLIPVFDSRTTPLLEETDSPKLALASTTFDIRSMPQADQLFFEVNEMGVPSPRILLDFALVRQAMSSTANWIGVTELSDDTSPRLERFRSASLVAGRLGASPAYVIASGAKQYAVGIGG